MLLCFRSRSVPNPRVRSRGEPPNPMPNSILRKARVLLVDDESSNVRLLERILEMFGCRARPEHERPAPGDAALPGDAAGHHPAGSAHAAPGRLCRDGAVPRRPPRGEYLPILILTADITVETKRRALAGGAKDLVTKPIDHSEVILRMKNLLENRFLHLELQRQNALLEQQVQERTASSSRRCGPAFHPGSGGAPGAAERARHDGRRHRARFQ